jgi:hypothetical protein
MKTESKTLRTLRLAQSLAHFKLSPEEIAKLLRVEKKLRRWHELQCGVEAGHVEEIGGEGSGKWEFVNRHGYRSPIRDAGKQAEKALNAFTDENSDLFIYVQPDPRGCALYLLKKSQVESGEELSAVYMRGVAICI